MDITTEILINARPADVAGIMFDPTRDRDWMRRVTSSEPQTAGIQPGAEVKRTSHVDGTPVAWTTAVSQFHFPHVLKLAISGGPSGYIAYDVQRGGGGTIAKIRASSEQDLFGFDLEKLRELVERG